MSPESKSKWVKVTFQISVEQYDEIKKKMQKLGYKTIAEFIRDAIREKLVTVEADQQ